MPLTKRQREIIQSKRKLISETRAKRKARLQSIVRRYEAGDRGRDNQGNPITEHYYNTARLDLGLMQREGRRKTQEINYCHYCSGTGILHGQKCHRCRGTGVE